MEKQLRDALVKGALEARKRAYTPYSNYTVGAAVYAQHEEQKGTEGNNDGVQAGEIFEGCNIENASFPVTMCAERCAIFTAVARGYRRITAIALTGGKEGKEADDFCAPCGMCLQVMTEFCSPDCPILVVKDETHVTELCLKDFLPHMFELTK
ncbi:MAG: cytidine deaminase [Blautia sp.]|nr:cytidine deaminase [Blautia sp.]